MILLDDKHFGYGSKRMHLIEKIKMDSWSENYSLSRDIKDQIYFRYNGRLIQPNVYKTNQKGDLLMTVKNSHLPNHKH